MMAAIGCTRLRLAYRRPLIHPSACAATQRAGAVAPPPRPGFLLGLWHGFIFPVAWFVSLFAPNIAIYAVPNNGGWYDFGYFLGIVVFGVGAEKSQVVNRDRVDQRPAGGSTDEPATVRPPEI